MGPEAPWQARGGLLLGFVLGLKVMPPAVSGPLFGPLIGDTPKERRVPDRLGVSIVAFATAPKPDRAKGLLGWLALEVDGLLFIDGVTLRRTRDGRLAISFPTRRDRRRVEHALVRPVNAAIHRELEREILADLGLEATSTRVSQK